VYLFICFKILFGTQSTQFARAEILNYRNYVWNGHGVDLETGNVSAMQATLRHWTVTDSVSIHLFDSVLVRLSFLSLSPPFLFVAFYVQQQLLL